MYKMNKNIVQKNLSGVFRENYVPSISLKQ